MIYAPLPGRTLTPEAEFFHAVGLFEGPLRKAIWELKFRGKSGLASFFADMFLKTCPRSLREIDAIVPVPASFWSELKRGYNQAGLLARELARRLDKPVKSGCLRRRSTHSQQGLSRAARLENAPAGFRLARSAVLTLQGANTVLLIDDVCTSGATLRTCIRLLKKAGVKRVWVGVLALKP